MAADDEQVKGEVIEMERRRCKALEGVDREALAELCDEDLIFAHGSTGRIEDKATHVQHMRPRRIERGELTVRVYGDVAIMTGPMTYYFENEEPRPHACVTQVWIKRPSSWKLVTFQT